MPQPWALDPGKAKGGNMMLQWLTLPLLSPSLQQQQPLRLLWSHTGAGRGAEPVEHPTRRDPHGGGR